jgi:hypothetical protein
MTGVYHHPTLTRKIMRLQFKTWTMWFTSYIYFPSCDVLFRRMKVVFHVLSKPDVNPSFIQGFLFPCRGKIPESTRENELQLFSTLRTNPFGTDLKEKITAKLTSQVEHLRQSPSYNWRHHRSRRRLSFTNFIKLWWTSRKKRKSNRVIMNWRRNTMNQTQTELHASPKDIKL